MSARSSLPAAPTAATARGRRLAPGEVRATAVALEDAAAEEVVAWAVQTFGEDVPFASSFEDAVLIDVAASVIDRPRVLFVDTGAHFPETLAFAEQVRRRYALDLHVVRPQLGPDSPACGDGSCCAVRKVAPMREALAADRSWLTGLRRTDSPERATTPVVEHDAVFDLVKISPLARWTDHDVAAREQHRRLPQHPLRGRGYRSIGCAPTTRPVADDEDPRAGRWPGQDKTECGLHV